MKYLRFLIFWGFSLIFIIVEVLVVVIFGPFKKGIFGFTCEHMLNSVAAKWGHLLFIFVPGWKLKIAGRENLPAKKNDPVIYISNHESIIDIPTAHCINRQFRWFSKAAVFNAPVLGKLMHLAGCIAIERGDRSSARNAMAACRDTLQRKKVPVFMFPEGTRSETGKMKDFKHGAFTLSIDTGYAILPIVMNGTSKTIRKGSILVNKAQVTITILPRVNANEGEDLVSFVNRVRDIMVSHHDET